MNCIVQLDVCLNWTSDATRKSDREREIHIITIYLEKQSQSSSSRACKRDGDKSIESDIGLWSVFQVEVSWSFDHLIRKSIEFIVLNPFLSVLHYFFFFLFGPKMNTNYVYRHSLYQYVSAEKKRMKRRKKLRERRCPAVRAVDITYSLYFGSCIYLGKQGTPITRAEKKSQKINTTTATATVTHIMDKEKT